MSDMREFVATPTVEELEAEIERLEADAENLRNTITSTHLSLKERDAEIERLDAALHWVLNYCRVDHRDGDAGRLAAITTLVSNTLKGSGYE